jgi:hypothetical protein
MDHLVAQQAVVAGAGWTVVKEDQVFISSLVVAPLYFAYIELFVEGGEEEVAIIVHTLLKQQTKPIGLFLLVVLHTIQIIKLPVGKCSGDVDRAFKWKGYIQSEMDKYIVGIHSRILATFCLHCKPSVDILFIEVVVLSLGLVGFQFKMKIWI